MAIPTTNLLFLFAFLTISSSSSQSTSPQNIQTFYPFPGPPAVLPPRNDPPAFGPESTAQPPPGRSSTRSAVGKAIGATAASTVVLSGLVFFLLLRRSRRKKQRRESGYGEGAVVTPPLPPAAADNFTRFNGNVKGVIVDENGLDVLYWRNLQDDDFKRQSVKEEQKQQQNRSSVTVSNSRKKIPIQEAPLLDGNSSSSHSRIWGENDKIIQSSASMAVNRDSTPVAVNRDSSSTALNRDSSIYHSKGKQPAPELPLPPAMVAAKLTAAAAVSAAKPVAPPPPPPPPAPLTTTAVPKAKAAAPPPPPPAPLTITAVPKAKAVAPPPPPPPSGKGKGAPPPPPRSSSNGEGSSTNGSGQVKLKPLHWDKLNPDVQHSMVWDKIDQGSFRFDGDLMEALFGFVATNRKSPQRSSNPPLGSEKIFILDPRKSQNTAIVLKALDIGRNEIIDTLNNGRGLNPDTLEKLTRIVPTDEETSAILAFDGDPARLADAESFLYHLLKAVPSAFPRFKAMLFRSNYKSDVLHIRESLQSLESACKELRTRGLFLKLLEAVLKAGNRLNAGTSRGNAQAFNLTALRKLSDVKSSDGKTTLLQFVVQEVVRAEGKRCAVNRNRNLSRTSSIGSDGSSDSTSRFDQRPSNKDEQEREYMLLGLPMIGGLSAEFSNVKKAATLDCDILVKSISGLAVQVVETRRMVNGFGSNGGFVERMVGFLDAAASETKELEEEERRVMELVKKTTDYYQAGSSRNKESSLLQLFVIVKDFLGMVDQACIEIARHVQRRRPASSSSSSTGEGGSSGSPRVFRFPKLPENFMSDRSSSSNSDNDIEN